MWSLVFFRTVVDFHSERRCVLVELNNLNLTLQQLRVVDKSLGPHLAHLTSLALGILGLPLAFADSPYSTERSTSLRSTQTGGCLPTLFMRAPFTSAPCSKSKGIVAVCASRIFKYPE